MTCHLNEGALETCIGYTEAESGEGKRDVRGLNMNIQGERIVKTTNVRQGTYK